MSELTTVLLSLSFLATVIAVTLIATSSSRQQPKEGVWIVLPVACDSEQHGAWPCATGADLRFANILPIERGQKAPAKNRHQRLQVELFELDRRYDTLTNHIAALDVAIGRELDNEHRLVLEDRRAELVNWRRKVCDCMMQYEIEMRNESEDPPVGKVVNGAMTCHSPGSGD